MERFVRQHTEKSIVLVGTFFPLLFMPNWFVRNKLLPAEDADAIAIEIMVNEYTKFSMAAISVEVQSDKLTLRSSEAAFDSIIKDLAVGVLTLMPETNITAFGLNVTLDVRFKELDFWHHVGDTLVPKVFWDEALSDSPRVGLRNLQLQVAKPAGREGVYNFGVSCLKMPLDTQFSLNNHFSFASGDSFNPKPDNSKAIKIIEESWEETLAAFEHVFGHVMNRVSEGFPK